MDVEDMIGKGPDKRAGDQLEVARQGDEVDPVLLHLRSKKLTILMVLFVQDQAGYLPSVCAGDDARLGIVGHDKGDGDLLMGGEVLEDAFGIGAAAGGEDGDVFHGYWGVILDCLIQLLEKQVYRK